MKIIYLYKRYNEWYQDKIGMEYTEDIEQIKNYIQKSTPNNGIEIILITNL